MLKIIKLFVSSLLLLLTILPVANAKEITRLNIGYFEAGKYDIHTILQDEYFKQVENLLPDSIKLVSIPEGYRSAEWDREKSKKMAKQLTSIKHIDLMLAVGPWVVQDLLDAGFDKPIIGMHQFNPKAEGLLKENNRPIADNLTIHFRPSKTFDDINALVKLVPIRKLGLLYFPTDDTTHSLYNHIKSLGEQYGFEVFTATEYDNYGKFAFYKSYNSIKKHRVDALYLPPLWGLSSAALPNFFKMLSNDRVPTFTDEGSLLIQHGATATNNFYGIVSEAYFNAYKTVEIINGATPADLPVIFRSGYHIGLNIQSAKKCKVKIRSDIYNSFQLISKEKNDHISVSTLSEVVNRALNQNPHILSQLDKLDAADAQIGIAKSTYLPQIYSEAELDYTDNNFHHNYHNNIEKEALRSSLNFSQTVFSKEKLKEIQSAKDFKKIMRISKLSEQLDLELAVSQAYLDYLKIQEQSNVIQNIRNMLSYNIEILHAKNLLHLTDSLGNLRLENFRYNLTLDYIENERLLKTTQILLNSLLNMPPDELFILQEEYFSENQFIQYESPIIDKLLTHSSQEKIGNNLLDKMLIQNPNQTKSDAVIAYNKTILEKNRSSFYPEFQLHGSLLYDDFQTETELFKEKNPSWYVGGKITLPLYLGGKRFKERKKAQALLSEAEYQKDAASLEIMRNGLANYQQFIQFTEQMTPAYQAKQRAYSSLEIANEQYSDGILSTTDYLEILKTTMQTELQSINIRYNYFASMAKIVHSLGIPVSDSFSDFVIQFHSELEY